MLASIHTAKSIDWNEKETREKILEETAKKEQMRILEEERRRHYRN